MEYMIDGAEAYPSNCSIADYDDDHYSCDHRHHNRPREHRLVFTISLVL
jgi:hypothetical protein